MKMHDKVLIKKELYEVIEVDNKLYIYNYNKKSFEEVSNSNNGYNIIIYEVNKSKNDRTNNIKNIDILDIMFYLFSTLFVILCLAEVFNIFGKFC